MDVEKPHRRFERDLRTADVEENLISPASSGSGYDLACKKAAQFGLASLVLVQFNKQPNIKANKRPHTMIKTHVILN